MFVDLISLLNFQISWVHVLMSLIFFGFHGLYSPHINVLLNDAQNIHCSMSVTKQQGSGSLENVSINFGNKGLI